MNIQDALLIISMKKKKLLTLTEVGNTLNYSRQYVNKYKNKDLPLEQIKMLESKYNVNLEYGLNVGDAVEIQYYENPKLSDVIKNPLITSVWLDKELVNKIWNKDEKNLKIIQMPGDTMNGGEYPIANEDILILDITIKKPVVSGVYAFTTMDESFIFINGIKQKANGSLMFYYKNPNYKTIYYTRQELKDMDFKIIGRIIKNISLEI